MKNEYYTYYNFKEVNASYRYNFLAMYDNSITFTQQYIGDYGSPFVYIDNCKYCNSIAELMEPDMLRIRPSGYWMVQMTAGQLYFESTMIHCSNFEDTMDARKKFTVMGFACGRPHIAYLLLPMIYKIQDVAIRNDIAYNCINIVANRITKHEYHEYREYDRLSDNTFGFPFPKSETGIYNFHNIMSPNFLEIFKNDIFDCIDSGGIFNINSIHPISVGDICTRKYGYNVASNMNIIHGRFNLNQFFTTFMNHSNTKQGTKVSQSMIFLPTIYD